MGKLVNTVGWSASRANTLYGCKRQYFYNYYLAWEGWNKSADLKRQEAYKLKNMTSLPMWVGTIVHDIIEGCLGHFDEHGVLPQMSQTKGMAVENLRTGWQQSIKAEWRADPKNKIRLMEHHHDIPVPKEKTEEAKAKVLKCLDTFYNLFPVIFGKDGSFEFLELEDFQSFLLKSGEKVTVKLDCAIKREDGDVYLIDWKTGKRTDNVIDQLSVYAMYVIKQLKIPLEKIKVVPVYLNNEHFIQPTPISMDQITGIAKKIKLETSEMIELHPHGMKLAQEKFTLTVNEWKCKYCNFVTICKDKFIS